MWARVSEVVLGCWLALCPFVFAHRERWFIDVGTGLAVALLALLSFSRPLRHAHLGTGLLAAGLLLHSYLLPTPVPEGVQHHILLGLTLMVFSIIPNHANLPPESWRSGVRN
jgi:hypothetical protein